MNLNDKLKQNVSDLMVLYVKLHDLHWHVRGTGFKVIHETTESYYNVISSMYDEVAERLVQRREVAPASLKTCLKLAKINESEEQGKYNSVEVLEIIIRDFKTLLDEYKKIKILSEKEGDIPTADLASGYISSLEKNIWMLEASNDMNS